MPQILVFGTSTEWGAWDEGGGWVDRLKQYCISLYHENPEHYFVVYNLGVSGDTSRELSVRIASEFRARKDPVEKNFCIIATGSNDAAYFPAKRRCLVSLKQYEQNLVKILTTAKRIADEVYCIDLEPVDDARMNPCPWRKEICYRNNVVIEYNAKLEEVCKRLKIKCILAYAAWKEKHWKVLLQDGLHPNGGGHKLTFETVKSFLEKEGILPKEK